MRTSVKVLAPINIRTAGRPRDEVRPRTREGWLCRQSMIDGDMEALRIGPWSLLMYRHFELGIYVLRGNKAGSERYHDEWKSLYVARLMFVELVRNVSIELASEVLQLNP